MEEILVLIVGLAVPIIMMLWIFVWFCFYLLFLVLVFLGIIFWVVMIIDVVKRDFKNKEDRVMWTLIVIFCGIIGAGIYYFTIKKKDKKKKKG